MLLIIKESNSYLISRVDIDNNMLSDTTCKYITNYYLGKVIINPTNGGGHLIFKGEGTKRTRIKAQNNSDFQAGYLSKKVNTLVFGKFLK